MSEYKVRTDKELLESVIEDYEVSLDQIAFLNKENERLRRKLLFVSGVAVFFLLVLIKILN